MQKHSVIPLILLSIIAMLCMPGFASAQTQETPANQADKDYNFAMEYIQMGQINKAKEMIKKALELQPDSMKIHRQYQNMFPYKNIIDYYRKQYEVNKENPLWVYLYYRLLTKDDFQEGCKGIREAEKKFPDFVYLQLASTTCDVANLNWAGAHVGLNNIMKRQDAPVDAFENALRLYSLSENTNLLLPTCKDGITRFPEEPSLYKLCLGYSDEIVPPLEKKILLEKAYTTFEESHQLGEILFIYARALKDEKEKFDYMHTLWQKYPSNKISTSIFSIMWAHYSRNKEEELLPLAKAVLQKDRVGDAFMYTTAVSHLIEKWKNTIPELEKFVSTVNISEFNWQGVLILTEQATQNKLMIKKLEARLPELINRIKQEQNISKDYLFRAYISAAHYYMLAKNNAKTFEYYRTALLWNESSFSESNWIEYLDILNTMKKKSELLSASASCYTYNMSKACRKYGKEYKENEFFARVRDLRKKLFPGKLQFNWKTFDEKEITSAKLAQYNLYFIVYVESEVATKFFEHNKESLKKMPSDFTAAIIVLGDTEEQARDYYKKLGLELPAAYDMDASQVFAIKGIPSIVLLDAEGYMVFRKYINPETDKDYKVDTIWQALLEEKTKP